VKRSRKGATRSKSRRWSAKVTKHSNALDLERNVFRSKDPRKIAVSLLNFYINRAGKNLPQKQKRILENAKDELRDVFGRG
jgi:Protein of unknown function (DUF3175)